MGKNVQHETVTTWTCDHCGKQDIVTHSSPRSTSNLPPGWVSVAIFEGVHAEIEAHYSDRITFEHPQLQYFGGHIYCSVCRKTFKMVTREIPEKVKKDSWALSRWLKDAWEAFRGGGGP